MNLCIVAWADSPLAHLDDRHLEARMTAVFDLDGAVARDASRLEHAR